MSTQNELVTESSSSVHEAVALGNKGNQLAAKIYQETGLAIKNPLLTLQQKDFARDL